MNAFARFVLGLALATTALLGLGATANPAQAAGSVGTQISFCSSYHNPNAAVILQYWNGQRQQWVDLKNGRTAANGCGTFRYVDAGYYYRVRQFVSSYTGYDCRRDWYAHFWTGHAQSVANRNVSVGNLVHRGTYTYC